MKPLRYLPEQVKVPNSRLSIVALSEGMQAYALQNDKITGVKEYDLPYSFPLLPYLTRMSEADEDVPDYEDVQDAILRAKESLD